MKSRMVLSIASWSCRTIQPKEDSNTDPPKVDDAGGRVVDGVVSRGDMILSIPLELWQPTMRKKRWLRQAYGGKRRPLKCRAGAAADSRPSCMIKFLSDSELSQLCTYRMRVAE